MIAEQEAQKRAQNLRDAMVLIESIKNRPTPDFSHIWADLNDQEVDEQVANLAHLHEWLNLS